MKIDKTIIDLLRKKKECDDVVLQYRLEDSNLTRFAENRITQNISQKIETLTVKAIMDERVGTAETTEINKNSLIKTLRRAENIALHMPKDPEFVPPLKPVKCDKVERTFRATTQLTPEAKAKQILKIAGEAKKKNANIAGVFYNGNIILSIMNTKGFFTSHRSTKANFSTTVTIQDGSGFAEVTEEDIKKINVQDIFNRAFKKAELSKIPIDIKPDDYPVILEPIALGRLMMFLSFMSDRRSADEGWSYFAKKIGKRIASPDVTIFSDPRNPENSNIPFDVENDGLPLKRQVWIKNGILKKLWTTRYWAKKIKVKPTGIPSNLIMEGGKESTEELLKKINYGLLVTRLWYIRFVNRKELILTGMTRDGFFLIENGRISKAVKNMRFNDSPFTILSNVKYLGKPERVEGRFFVPAVFAKKFHFASATKF